MLRPLDEDERFLRQNFIPTEVRQLVRRAETVQVEMVNRRASRRVLMHEGERRTGHVVGHSVTTTDRFGERRLAGAELAHDRHDERGLREMSKALAPLDQLSFVDREMAFVREGRNDWFVRHPSSTPARDRRARLLAG